jgi:hypothetical protein
MRFCANCGFQAEAEDVYCSSCGHEFQVGGVPDASETASSVPFALVPTGRRHRRSLVIGAAVVVIFGAAGAAYALSTKNSPSLPAQFTAVQFGQKLFLPAASGTTTHATGSVEISLGSDGSITETQNGLSDSANNEEQLDLTETFSTPGSSSVTLESVNGASRHRCGLIQESETRTRSCGRTCLIGPSVTMMRASAALAE